MDFVELVCKRLLIHTHPPTGSPWPIPPLRHTPPVGSSVRYHFLHSFIQSKEYNIMAKSIEVTAKNYLKKFARGMDDVMSGLNNQHEVLAWALVEAVNNDTLEHVNALYEVGVTENYLIPEYQKHFVAYITAALEFCGLVDGRFVIAGDVEVQFAEGVSLASPFYLFKFAAKAPAVKKAGNPTQDLGRMLARTKKQHAGDAPSTDSKAVLALKIAAMAKLFAEFELLDTAHVVKSDGEVPMASVTKLKVA